MQLIRMAPIDRRAHACACIGDAFGSGSDIEDVNRGERRAGVLEVHRSLSSGQFHFNISSVQTDLPPPSLTHPFYLFISLSFAHLLTLYWLVSHWPLELVARTVSRLKSQDKNAFYNLPNQIDYFSEMLAFLIPLRHRFFFPCFFSPNVRKFHEL